MSLYPGFESGGSRPSVSRGSDRRRVKRHPGRTPTVLLTVLAPVSWGTTYVTVTELLPPGRPLFLAAMRVAPAGLVLVLLGTLLARWRPNARDWFTIAASSMFNFVVFFPLLVVAAYRLPGGVAATTGGLQPLLVVGLTAITDAVVPRRRDLLVAAAALVGVAMVVLGPDAGYDLVGLSAALGANLSFATGVVLTRRRIPPPNRITATGWQLVLAAVVLVPLALAVEGVPPSPGIANLAGYFHLSIIGTAVAFVLWFRGIERLDPVTPPLLGLASPITGVAVGWILLDQVFTPIQIVGLAVTLGAIGYGATRPAHRRHSRQSPDHPI